VLPDDDFLLLSRFSPEIFQMHVLVKRMGFQVTKKLQVCVLG